jgi:hypothetical protein
MMPERPQLRIVDPETGEFHDQDCPNCAGLETEVRAWRTRYHNLKRDRNAEAREHKLFPEAKKLFDFWREECRHPRSKWTADRFWTLAPLLAEYGMETCRQAIRGAAYDPATRRRRNGTIERFDQFSLIFRNADKLESFVNRAPKRGDDSDPKPPEK